MNRRGFFSRLLGAACLAVAERVLPSSLATLAAPVGNVLPMPRGPVLRRSGTTFVSEAASIDAFVAKVAGMPDQWDKVDIEALRAKYIELQCNPPYVGGKQMDLSGLRMPPF